MYDAVIEFGLNASQWLQTTYPQIVDVMLGVSDFGRFEAYLLIILLIYWCYDKHLGIQIAYVLIFSTFINTAVKQSLRQPRPFWLDSNLAKKAASGYGFPSGHVQGATTFFFFFAGWFREKWLWGIATLIVATMALSRVYLGVHFVHDVAAGFLLGSSILIGFALVQHYLGKYFIHRIFGQRLLIMALIPLLLLTIWAIIIIWRGEPDVPASWRELALAAEFAHTQEAVQSAALLFGLGVGFTLERSRVRFQTSGAIWQRVVRFFVGAAGAGVIYLGLDKLYALIIPEGTLWLALPLLAFQAVLIGLWITYYAPKLFVMLRVARFSAEPELPYTIHGTSFRKKNTK